MIEARSVIVNTPPIPIIGGSTVVWIGHWIGPKHVNIVYLSDLTG